MCCTSVCGNFIYLRVCELAELGVTSYFITAVDLRTDKFLYVEISLGGFCSVEYKKIFWWI